MLDCRAILASAQAVWVVLWGLGCWSVVMLNFGEVLAPAYAVLGVLWVWDVDGWLYLMIGQFWPLLRPFVWF